MGDLGGGAPVLWPDAAARAQASDIIKKGKMCSLFINDLDAGAGRMGDGTQYTVNNQMVNATLMNIADNPTNVQLPGVYKTVSPAAHFSASGRAREFWQLFKWTHQICKRSHVGGILQHCLAHAWPATGSATP